MRMNKKGMTSVELLAAFAIISVIVVGLFDMVLNYKNRQQIEAVYSEVTAYANNLQKVVQDDFIKKHLTSASIVSLGKQVNVTMNNPAKTTSFIISAGRYDSNLNVVSVGTITYDGTKYPPPSIPDLILDDASTITMETLPVSDTLTISYLDIHIVLRHPNFSNRNDEADYGIYEFHITCPINYTN